MHNNEILDEQDRVAAVREHHYISTLREFEELVRQYGAEKIIKDMADDVFWIINKNLGD